MADVRGVRDIDVVELIRVASRSSGRYTVLAACDPNVGVTESHFARLAEKVAAGARVLETQPIFDVCRFATWLAHLREAGIDVPLLVDVSVVGTVQEAELLPRIPFVQAPDDLAMRLRHDRSAGIELAAQTVGALRELDAVADCHLSPLSASRILRSLSWIAPGPPGSRHARDLRAPIASFSTCLHTAPCRRPADFGMVLDDASPAEPPGCSPGTCSPVPTWCTATPTPLVARRFGERETADAIDCAEGVCIARFRNDTAVSSRPTPVGGLSPSGRLDGGSLSR